MDACITPSPLFGRINAVGSKSDIHRLLICSAFADKKTEISGFFLSDDIAATVRCIEALGASVEIYNERCFVTPIANYSGNPFLDCGESGTTLRFMLPTACAVCEKAAFSGSGRLPERPIDELIVALSSGGVDFSGKKLPFSTKGKLKSGEYRLPGNISSQYISGLLTALCLIEGKSEIMLTTPLESASYVDMTLATLSLFGAEIIAENGKYTVYGKGKLVSPEKAVVDGDWSNALFFMVAGAIGQSVEINGLSLSSVQGDKAAAEILKRFGADVAVKNNTVYIKHENLCGCDIDISQIPDTLPALAVAAAFANGKSRFFGGKRLRMKESDRIATTCGMINSLGGNAEETKDGLTVYGNGDLSGGIANGENDHRIVMAAAAAASGCKDKVVIKGVEAVNKSYPTFFSDFKKLGGIADVI